MKEKYIAPNIHEVASVVESPLLNNSTIEYEEPHHDDICHCDGDGHRCTCRGYCYCWGCRNHREDHNEFWY